MRNFNHVIIILMLFLIYCNINLYSEEYEEVDSLKSFFGYALKMNQHDECSEIAINILKKEGDSIPNLNNVIYYEFLVDYFEKHIFSFSKANEYQRKLTKYYLSINQCEKLINSYTAEARQYVEMAFYDKAYISSQNALKYSLIQKDSSNFSEIYNILGKIFYYCSDYKTAKEYYAKAVNSPKASSSEFRSLALNNSIAFMKDTNVAFRTMNKAIELAKFDKNYHLLNLFYHNMIMVSMNKKDINRANKYLSIVESLPKSSIDSVYYFIDNAIVSVETGKYYKSMEAYEKALKILDRVEFVRDKMNVLSISHYLYSYMGEFEKAYNLLLEYVQLDNRIPKNVILRDLFNLKQELAFNKEREKLQYEKAKSEYTVSLIFIISIFVILVIYLLYTLRLKKLKEKTLRLEAEKLKQEKNEQEIQLNYELKEQNFKKKQEILNVKRLQQYQDEVLVTNIIKKLKDINSKFSVKDLDSEIYSLIRELEVSKDKSDWNEIEAFITESDAYFYENLLSDFPDLTVGERRLCTFLHMNMTTKEISNVTRKSINSITTARSRLRTKLNIESEQSIVAFLDRYSGKKNTK